MSNKYLIIFFILFLTSCSNLEIKNIKCDNDSSKCPNNSICVEGKCELCPKHSEKEGSNCICEFNNYIMDKETNKCLYRPLCNTNNDCNNNEQCAFVTDSLTSSVNKRCVAIGPYKFNDTCSNFNNCQSELSCYIEPWDSYRKICVPNEYICSFSTNKLAEVTNNCNQKAGLCARKNQNLSKGYCIIDECDPTSLTNCPNEETCVFTGFIYQCIKYNSNGANVGEPCNTNEDCNEYLTCSDDKKCIHFCRPNNIYSYDDSCLGSCDDLKTIPIFKNAPKVKNLDEGVIGICDYK